MKPHRIAKTYVSRPSEAADDFEAIACWLWNFALSGDLHFRSGERWFDGLTEQFDWQQRDVDRLRFELPPVGDWGGSSIVIVATYFFSRAVVLARRKCPEVFESVDLDKLSSVVSLILKLKSKQGESRLESVHAAMELMDSARNFSEIAHFEDTHCDGANNLQKKAWEVLDKQLEQQSQYQQQLQAIDPELWITDPKSLFDLITLFDEWCRAIGESTTFDSEENRHFKSREIAGLCSTLFWYGQTLKAVNAVKALPVTQEDFDSVYEDAFLAIVNPNGYFCWGFGGFKLSVSEAQIRFENVREKLRRMRFTASQYKRISQKISGVSPKLVDSVAEPNTGHDAKPKGTGRARSAKKLTRRQCDIILKRIAGGESVMKIHEEHYKEKWKSYHTFRRQLTTSFEVSGIKGLLRKAKEVHKDILQKPSAKRC